MCAPSPPKPVDTALAAQQTAAGNQNAAIAAQYGNMTNQVGPQQYTYDAQTGQYTPTGTSTGVTYTNPAQLDSQGSMPFDMSSLTQAQKDAYYAGKGLPKNFVKSYTPQQWSQTQTLGANDQRLFNQSQATQLGLSDMALTGLDKVRNAIGESVSPEIALQRAPEANADQMTKGVQGEFAGGGLDTSGLQTDVNNAGQIANSLGNVNGLSQYVVDNNADSIQLNSGANQLARGLGRGQNNANQIQTNLGIDPQLLQQGTANALYQANTQYLDPQFNQQQSKLENQLANQGITRGSEAYNNAMLNFNNQKQQAYESARNQAIGGATSAAQGLFGMGLQGAQFGNTALGQQFGQNVTAQQLQNTAAGQNNQNAQANMGLTNAALGQQFGQNLQAGQFANNAQQQSYNQALGTAQFQNAAQQQQYNQNLADMQTKNAAVNQRFGMDTSNQAALNNAQQQQFNAGLANANLNNQALSQLYGQQLQSTQQNNATSNQQLAQNQAIQQNPLNILQALRTGAQLNTANLPAVGVSQPGQLANWSGADMLGAANATNQYNQGIYNAQSAAASQLASAGIGAAGMMGGAGIKAFASDFRLKKNIIKLGIHKTLGIGLYTWDYLWGEKGAGVMAQELEKVMPQAVITMKNGYKAVNYSMLGA